MPASPLSALAPASAPAAASATAQARLQAALAGAGRHRAGSGWDGDAGRETTPLSRIFDAWAARHAELRRLCHQKPSNEVAAAAQEALAEALGIRLMALEARIAEAPARDHRDLALKAAALTGYLAYHCPLDLEAEADALLGLDAA